MKAEPRYLLDTNILSALMRDPSGGVANKIRVHGEIAICTSIIVAGELRFGAAKRGSAALSERVSELLDAIDVLPLNDDADRHYGDIRLALEMLGTPIGPNDLWIAAQARAAGLCVVTDNIREFSRVPELALENWLESIER